MPDLLSLKQVALGYDAPNILSDVNLSVAAGEIVALVGQNGVGKSSLLHSIMGLLEKTEGIFQFNQQFIRGKKAYEIARLGIALVRQEHAVFADLQVAEHFALVNSLDLATNLCYFPDLLPKAKQQAKKLSGGQRQQLAIALALATQPKLLLLDEPSANIQPSVVESMIATLLQINRESGVAMLIAEQNLSVISRLAATAYQIKAGRVLPQRIIIDGNDKVLTENLSQSEREYVQP